jgi:hypothetical protein
MVRRGCWADSLGDCQGPISGEHLISKTTFGDDPKTVTIKGLDYCLDTSKVIGINAFTANILCFKHNSGFGPVDAAGRDFIDKMNSLGKEHRQRSELPSLNWMVLRHEVDGGLLERWFLKSIINVASLKNWPIGAPTAPPGRPTLELVEIAYGKRSFTGGGGLYGALRLGEDLSDANIRVETIVSKSGQYVAGAMMSLGGVKFGMSLTEAALPPNIGDVMTDWRGAKLIKPFNGIDIKINDRVSQKLVFRW